MLRCKSTNTKKECIYLIVICHCCFVYIKKMWEDIYYMNKNNILFLYNFVYLRFSCTDTSNGVSVECYNRGLDSIPTDLPDNTYKL
jgi:hypothetical protein